MLSFDVLLISIPNYPQDELRINANTNGSQTSDIPTLVLIDVYCSHYRPVYAAYVTAALPPGMNCIHVYITIYHNKT